MLYSLYAKNMNIVNVNTVVLVLNLVLISIGNYTVREVFMKNRTRVWRNVYNTASA